MSHNSSSTSPVQQNMFCFWLRILGIGLASLLLVSFVVFMWPRIVSSVISVRKHILKPPRLPPLLPLDSKPVPLTLFATTSTVLSSYLTRLGAGSLHTMRRTHESLSLHHGLWNRNFLAVHPYLLPMYESRPESSEPLVITATISHERTQLAVGRARAVCTSVVCVPSRLVVMWSGEVLKWWRKVGSIRLTSMLTMRFPMHVMYSRTTFTHDMRPGGDSDHWVLSDEHGFHHALPSTSLRNSPALSDIASLALDTNVDDTSSDESFMSSTTLTALSTPGSLTSVDDDEPRPWTTDHIYFSQSSSPPCEGQGSPGSLADVPEERDITERDDICDDIITERKKLLYASVSIEPIRSSFPSVDISTFFFQEERPSCFTAPFQDASVPTIIVTLPSDPVLRLESASIDSDYLSARGSDWYYGFDLDTRSYTRSSGLKPLDKVLGIIGCLLRSAFSYVFGPRN